MFLVELYGIDNKSLLSLVSQNDMPFFKPTVLDLKCSEFFSSHSRDHVVGVGFFSNSNIFHGNENYVDSGGSSYFIPNRKSNFWSEDFSGLFS